MPRGKGAANGGIKLARKHKETGKVEARPRGRRHPDYEYGYQDEAGEFQAGDPPTRRRRRRRGRPAGSRVRRIETSSRKSASSGLSEIEQIVAREVETRLKRAKAAALEAFNRALGV
ncbi:MAG TPA: hypothetical protein VEJ63_13415 [Planctomycetota bacterium]|nr:hypothetical protein [Planctomycetota bacterium]